MKTRNRFVLCGLLVAGVICIAGCPVNPFNASAALGLQDWGRDLLSIPAAVIIGELIDEAQGTNVAADEEAIAQNVYDRITSELEAGQLGTPVPGPAGADGEDGEDGRDGVDGTDGVDGQDGLDGADGQDGKDGVDGQDGADGQDGEDFLAVALGCVGADGTDEAGYGYNATKIAGRNGTYAVALVGYAFPEGFDPADLVILVTPDAIAQQEIVTSFDPEVGFGFLVEFRDVWLNQVNTDFCFAVYDVSVDPYTRSGAE